MISEVTRKSLYWFFDFIKGSPVRKHLNDIQDKLNSFQSDPEQLDKILSYAVQETPFYRRYSRYKSLKDFPVINKHMIKENYADIQSRMCKEKKVIKMSTSGSTGTPFVIYQDINKRNRCLAEMIYYWGLTGYEIGMKYIYFRSWNSQNRKGRISAFARNVIMGDVLDLEDNSLKQIREQLMANRKIKMILGYASTLECLADYLSSHNDSPAMYNIKSVIAISEALSCQAQEKLKKVFNCPVISHYSNSENGVLAQECHTCTKREYHFNSASFILELLDLEKDVPVSPGKPGRVVITDLYNYAMPLIRYDTGDVAIQKETSFCKWSTPMLASIEGRTIDFIYNTSGKRISPHDISVKFWEFSAIKQYQFIQTGEKSYTIKIISSVDKKKQLIKVFKLLLGEDAEITVDYVTEIPLLQSGKRKYIINEINH